MTTDTYSLQVRRKIDATWQQAREDLALGFVTEDQMYWVTARLNAAEHWMREGIPQVASRKADEAREELLA